MKEKKVIVMKREFWKSTLHCERGACSDVSVSVSACLCVVLVLAKDPFAG